MDQLFRSIETNVYSPAGALASADMPVEGLVN